ncbi:MAG: hypothetical protein KDE53_38965 [Caldilineaceae bacterium]|nr:hypothetical protein [Caldilineaceae bacterium]
MQQKRQIPYRLWTVRLWTTSIILVLISVFVLPTAAFADPDAPTHKIFLPVISGQAAEVTDAAPTCGLNEQEQRIEALLLTTPNQGRVRLVCNATLAAVARARAADMGRRAYFDHVNPDGQGPNYLVRSAGYQLPSEYSTEVNGNNIESIGAGAGDADGMWNAWMASNKHVTHILGKTSFFAEQIDYGIGFAQVPGSPYQYYWVFISSKPA